MRTLFFVIGTRTTGLSAEQVEQLFNVLYGVAPDLAGRVDDAAHGRFVPETADLDALAKAAGILERRHRGEQSFGDLRRAIEKPEANDA